MVSMLFEKRKLTQKQKIIEWFILPFLAAFAILVTLGGDVFQLKAWSRSGSIQGNLYQGFKKNSTSIATSSDKNVVITVVLEMINHRKSELSSSSIRYYIYQDPALDNQQCRDLITRGGGRPLFLNRWGNEIRSELYFLDVLKEQQKYQTDNFYQADLYIIPYSIGASIPCVKNYQEDYDRAFGALYNHSLFQATNGHKHVMLSLLVPFHKHHDVMIGRTREMEKHYRQLWNVTVANDIWWAGMKHLVDTGVASGNDFEADFRDQQNPYARHSFSMGLHTPNSALELIPATSKRFYNSTNFVFFHTRVAPSLFNSTQYRHAALKQEGLLDALPKSSIGYDLPKEEWVEQFTSSKFCLVMRGDTIHTHALLRSVRVGCIPVMVANQYPWYAPTFQSSIQMQDYAIFLEEAAFLQNPLGELKKLQELSKEEIEEKLLWLSFAQQLFFPDHPESLFVPAFLKEANLASRVELGGPIFPVQPPLVGGY